MGTSSSRNNNNNNNNNLQSALLELLSDSRKNQNDNQNCNGVPLTRDDFKFYMDTLLAGACQRGNLRWPSDSREPGPGYNNDQNDLSDNGLINHISIQDLDNLIIQRLNALKNNQNVPLPMYSSFTPCSYFSPCSYNSYNRSLQTPVAV